jgi:hypothetical protein
MGIVASGNTSETSQFLDELEHNHLRAFSTGDSISLHYLRLAAALPLAGVSLSDCGFTPTREKKTLSIYYLCCSMSSDHTGDCS